MGLQAERPSSVDPERLERRLASQQRQVVGVQDGLVRIDDPAAGDRQREQRHARTASGRGARIAARSGRAFTRFSRRLLQLPELEHVSSL